MTGRVGAGDPMFGRVEVSQTCEPDEAVLVAHEHIADVVRIPFDLLKAHTDHNYVDNVTANYRAKV